MNPGSVVRKRLRTWLPWLVHSFVLTVLLIQLMPAATQAQNGGDDNTLFLPATSSEGDWLPPVEGESIEIVDESEAMFTDPLGDWLSPVEGEIIEIMEESETMPADIASISATDDIWLEFRTVGNQFNQSTRYCILYTLPFDVAGDADGGRIRLIMQHETSSSDEIRIADYFIGFELAGYGTNNGYPGRTGWSRTGISGDHKFILDDGARHTVLAPWNWATITDYHPITNVTTTGNDVYLCSHPYVYSRFFFYDD